MQRIGRAGAALAGLTGIVVLIGWYSGIVPLTEALPGRAPVMPNAGLALVALALALTTRKRRPALALGIAVAALGGATLVEEVLRQSFGIDRLPGMALSGHASRMAPATALSLVLLGGAVVAGRFRHLRFMRALAMAALLFAYVTLLGHGYSASSLYTVGGATQMAIPTAVCIALLSLAILLDDPTAGIVGLVRDDGSAGRLMRALLPALVVGPALLGWLRLWGQRHGWLDTDLGVALLVASMTALGCAMCWRVAAVLRQLDRHRNDAVREMAEANRSLEDRVAQRTKELVDREIFTAALLETAEVGIVWCDADGANFVRNRAERAMLGLGADSAHDLRPEAAAASIDVLDRFGDRIPAESYPLLRAVRGENPGVVELLLGPAGGPHREIVSYNAQIVGTDGVVLGAVSALTDVSAERAVSRALGDERAKLIEAQRLGQLGSFEHDFATDTWTFSEQMNELWGVGQDRFSAELSRVLMHEEDRDTASQAWDELCRDGGSYTHEFRIHRANDGAERRLRSNIEVDVDSDGRPVRGRGTHLDITELAAAKQAALEATAFYDAVLAATPDFTFVTELATNAVVYGSRDKEILGINADELEAMGSQLVSTLVHPDDKARLLAVNAAARELIDGQVLQLRYRGMHTDGQWHWLSRRVTPFRRDADGRVIEVLGVMRDITDVVEAEARLSHAALHDDLTGLPNRALLIDRLDTALARSARDGREVAVLFCDLDGFKRVNDTAGHAAGDAVLIETARRLTDILRPADTIARVGGDEFVIIVEPSARKFRDGPVASRRPADDRQQSIRVAERISEALSEPINVNGINHVVTTSIGISYATRAPGTVGGPIDAEQVLQHADAAMYLAKGRGKNRFEIFEHGLRTDPVERRRVEQILRNALERFTAPAPLADRGDTSHGAARFSAVYQPVFDLDARAVVSFEALARLIDADGVEISPDVFIGVAEEAGLIHVLGAVMLKLACSQLRTWHEETAGLERVTVAVKISALQAQHASFRNDVTQALEEHGLDPRKLVLQLTEQTLLQVAHSTLTHLRTLRAAGVGISVDDFGIGYASLRHLATLPVSSVKVHLSFTAGLPHDDVSAKIVKAIAGLAADMSLACIVEGVETAAQLAALPRGIQVQGYFTGRPQLPADIDLRTLQTQSHLKEGLVHRG